MVDQLPNLGREEEMLKEMGVASIDALFADVPESVRMVGDLPLPDAQSEEELLADAKRLLGANLALGDQPSFLGAGLYRNFVPSCVFQLVTRGEFLTSYTPYQPRSPRYVASHVGVPVAYLRTHCYANYQSFLYDDQQQLLKHSLRSSCAQSQGEQKDTVYISELTPARSNIRHSQLLPRSRHQRRDASP